MHGKPVSVDCSPARLVLGTHQKNTLAMSKFPTIAILAKKGTKANEKQSVDGSLVLREA